MVVHGGVWGEDEICEGVGRGSVVFRVGQGRTAVHGGVREGCAICEEVGEEGVICEGMWERGVVCEGVGG